MTDFSFPKHDAGMVIEHNDHKVLDMPIDEWIDYSHWLTWRNSDDMERCIQNDEVWSMRWYPSSPLGFIAIAAPTLKELLDWARMVDPDSVSLSMH